MANKKMKVHGLKEIDRVLRQLPNELQKKAIFFALRKGAQVVAADMKNRVPVRTGDLRDSIADVRTAKKAARGGAQVRIGFRKPHSRRAHLTEFGTSTQPAQPFVRPAIDAKGKQAIEVVGAELVKATVRIAKKLAGPNLKKSGLKS